METLPFITCPQVLTIWIISESTIQINQVPACGRDSRCCGDFQCMVLFRQFPISFTRSWFLWMHIERKFSIRSSHPRSFVAILLPILRCSVTFLFYSCLIFNFDLSNYYSNFPWFILYSLQPVHYWCSLLTLWYYLRRVTTIAVCSCPSKPNLVLFV